MCRGAELSREQVHCVMCRGAELSREQVHCVMCRGAELSREQVRSWYENRACEIEQLSGQVDGALQLIKLAIDKSVEVCSL